LGTIDVEGRSDYGAVGSVVNLAARICDVANAGQILVSQRVYSEAEDLVESTALGTLTLKGFVRPVGVFSIQGARASATPGPWTGGATTSPPAAGRLSPLSEREQDVVALITQGCSNREIARELTIAEATAVRHVANILDKLGLKSRAQVAVWAVERGLRSRRPSQPLR
jgi:DNA-binding NarL/FixJ family response regulator